MVRARSRIADSASRGILDPGVGRGGDGRALHGPRRERHVVRRYARRGRRQALRAARRGRRPLGRAHRHPGPGPGPAQRRRLSRRRPLRGGEQPRAALRRHRDAPRCRPGTPGRCGHVPHGPVPRLEVHPLRPRRPPLRPGRRAVQRLPARRSLRHHRPAERRHRGLRGGRPRRAQYGRLRLASRFARAVVHRQRPRLDGRRPAARRVEPARCRRPPLRLPALPRR